MSKTVRGVCSGIVFDGMPTLRHLSLLANRDGGWCGSSSSRNGRQNSSVRVRPPCPLRREALLIRLTRPAFVSRVRAVVGGGEVRPTEPWWTPGPHAGPAPHPTGVRWHDRSPAVHPLPPSDPAPRSRSKGLRRPPPVWPGRAPILHVALPSAGAGQTPPARLASR